VEEVLDVSHKAPAIGRGRKRLKILPSNARDEVGRGSRKKERRLSAVLRFTQEVMKRTRATFGVKGGQAK